MSQTQAIIDSVRGKIVRIQTDLDLEKTGTTKAGKKKIADYEKMLKELTKKVDEISQKHGENKLFADKIKQIILELDQQINELSRETNKKELKG